MIHLEICGTSHPISSCRTLLAVGIARSAVGERCSHSCRHDIGECQAGILRPRPKLPCGAVPPNPAGGGKLKAFGEKFKANGFKVK